MNPDPTGGPTATALPGAAQTSAPVLDPVALNRLRDLDPSGSNQLLPRIVNAYFRTLDKLLPELQAARTDSPDLEVIRHVAHTLKSSSASLGATTLAATCAEIELLVRAGQTQGLDHWLGLFDTEVEQVRHALHALITPPL